MGWGGLRSLAIVSMVCSALALPAAGETGEVVVMKNGDRITGDVTRIWDDELFIECDYTDEFAIDLAAVAWIETAEPVEIELRDESELTGRLVRTDEEGMVLIGPQVRRPLEPLAIKELEEIEERFDWQARSDLGFRASRGNTETTDFLWQASGFVKMGDHRHRADLSLERKSQDGTDTKEQDALTYVYSWFFGESWFFSAGSGYERDPIRELDYRYTPGVGLGVQIFDDADQQLELSLSTVWVSEKIGGVADGSGAARWDFRFTRDLLSGDLEFFHLHRFFHYLTGRENNVLDTETGIRWDLWDDVYLNAQVNWDWESDPAAGNEKEDVTYSLGFGIEFD